MELFRGNINYRRDSLSDLGTTHFFLSFGKYYKFVKNLIKYIFAIPFYNNKISDHI